jgi:hypothetical protein
MNIWRLAGVLIALSPDVVVAQAPRTTWICNANAGQYSRNGLSVTSGMKISGTIKFREKHGGTKWASSAAVNFRKARGESKFGGLSFFYAQPSDEALTISLVGFDGRRPVVIRQVSARDPIAFTVAIEPNGDISATIGGRSYKAEGRQFGSGIAQASCSSANVEFSELTSPLVEY